jgi:GT2 family glycosyltransferase
MSLKIAVLLTCFNRREKTISCLTSLFDAILPKDYSLDVFLVDDGSTDGTSESVNQHFPQVKVVKGDGTLFWNRGMHLAWKSAREHSNNNFYLWLNDDVKIKPNAIKILLENYQEFPNSIIAGVMASEKDNSITYGGVDKNNDLIVPNTDYPKPCYYINGNLVLVSSIIFDKVGMLDPIFTHAIGDFDYGLRARKLGFETRISSEILGFCEDNALPPVWCRYDVPLLKRIKSLYSPSGYCHPYHFFIYDYRHFGIFSAVKHYFSIHLRLIFPQLWK